MKYQEEIQYRDELMEKAGSKEKLTSDDWLCLATHRVYNRCLEYPYLNTDIIQLKSDTLYSVCVTIEKATYAGRILPVLAAPMGKGKIFPDGPIVDCDGNTSTKQFVKMLGLLISPQQKEKRIRYQSMLGLLEISYECEYFDYKHKLMITKSSDIDHYDFAMLRQELSDHKIRYSCKAPTTNDFNNLVFTVEWDVIEA